MATKGNRHRSWGLALGILAATTLLEAQTAPSPITVISEKENSTIPVSQFSGVSMIPLSALAELVGAELRPSSEQAVSLSANGRQARITDGRNFVPVQGKLVLLQSPARHVSGNWFVPIDFISKVLPAFSKESLVYRESERMLIVGDAFPTLEVRSTRDPAYTRIEVTTSRAVPIDVSEVEGEVRLTIQTPYLMTSFEEEEILDEVVERISLERGDRNYELKVKTGSRFWTLQAVKREYPEPGVVLDLLRSRVPTRPAGTETGGVETISEVLDPMLERGAEPARSTEGLPGAESVSLGSDPTSPADILSRNSGPTRLRIVALDPGHGGAETGAEGKNGLIEKDLVLSISRRLREILQERLGLRVVLTRDGDRNLALDERAAVANNNKADLFISIHADASPSREARGSSVYFLSYSSEDPEAAVASPRSRSSADAELDFILWDMAQASHLSQSSQLAEIFQEELLSATGMDKVNRGIKQNTFRVLKGATMPAVLVEVGFISNPAEEDLLKTQNHQEQLAEALYRGVLRFKDVYEDQPRADGAPQGRK